MKVFKAPNQLGLSQDACLTIKELWFQNIPSLPLNICSCFPQESIFYDILIPIFIGVFGDSFFYSSPRVIKESFSWVNLQQTVFDIRRQQTPKRIFTTVLFLHFPNRKKSNDLAGRQTDFNPFLIVFVTSREKSGRFQGSELCGFLVSIFSRESSLEADLYNRNCG